MAAVVARAPPLPSRSSTPPPHLTLNTSSRGTPAAIPNKHIPICSPGPQPAIGLETPPASPPSKETETETSLLYPPDHFAKLYDEGPIYGIDAATLARAVDHVSKQPLPDPTQTFPWLHGLHPENHIQLQFFVARRKSLLKSPTCYRGLTIVNASRAQKHSRLKGAVPPNELLALGDQDGRFMDIDPRDGFSVRNFQIQTCKMATISDIVVYGNDWTKVEEVLSVARKIRNAQLQMQEMLRANGQPEAPVFNTFVVTDSFRLIEETQPQLVACDSKEAVTGNFVDFFQQERIEMFTMSHASEITHNVFLGPTPDATIDPLLDTSMSQFDVYIEANDLAQMPDTGSMRKLRAALDDLEVPTIGLEFPSSGSIIPPNSSWSDAEAKGLIEMCRWIYEAANPTSISDDTTSGAELKDPAPSDTEGDTIMLSDLPCKTRKPRRVLIHCADGYTESSLLGLAYMMFAEALPAHSAWLTLHRDRGRNFFAYPSDVALLTALQSEILRASPLAAKSGGGGSVPLSFQLQVDEPTWMSKLDGSLPSRILPYMYLGNLTHANNPTLLRELGIGRVLSIGEPVSWSSTTPPPSAVSVSSPTSNSSSPPTTTPLPTLLIDRVQDNGVDPLILTTALPQCLSFIAAGRALGHATLVHCRVGVSRSATVCIAEVMRAKGWGFARAYCFVRARRLNVIIQPHLRFVWELLKWEEGGRATMRVGRECEWAECCREIAAMNKPYARQQ
ncbi:hypothetical protein P152DRAFT_463407 [Eremomyces bilateralis CBS 781.70]|uniref:Uncharacterized protein n=1 Tax=Eremomyces bilateralis CBS 781.70 TaxID=1392243 RepID=A0A6G1GGF3_9PEZI|nr:uncharacterized protein P152DRAFT_463407 [Eremomyces bilateralis CBS 781.70]KAF1817133.1 hypothetical protein P152DRAFT_463407 [Eremomyces bilateralis CBS 781.70]